MNGMADMVSLMTGDRVQPRVRLGRCESGGRLLAALEEERDRQRGLARPLRGPRALWRGTDREEHEGEKTQCPHGESIDRAEG
jgi:hypothetical protein